VDENIHGSLERDCQISVAGGRNSVASEKKEDKKRRGEEEKQKLCPSGY